MGNPFGKILGWLKALGRKLGGALVSVGKHITEEQFDYALMVARAAVDRFTDNANRRTWAVHEVQTKFGVSESIARMAVELAVHTLKRGEQKLFEELDELLTPETEGVVVTTSLQLSEDEAKAVVEVSPLPEDDGPGQANQAQAEPAAAEPETTV